MNQTNENNRKCGNPEVLSRDYWFDKYGNVRFGPNAVIKMENGTEKSLVKVLSAEIPYKGKALAIPQELFIIDHIGPDICKEGGKNRKETLIALDVEKYSHQTKRLKEILTEVFVERKEVSLIILRHDFKAERLKIVFDFSIKRVSLFPKRNRPGTPPTEWVITPNQASSC